MITRHMNYYRWQMFWLQQTPKVRQVPINVQQGPRVSMPESSDSEDEILTVTHTRKSTNVVEIEEIEENETLQREVKNDFSS